MPQGIDEWENAIPADKFNAQSNAGFTPVDLKNLHSNRDTTITGPITEDRLPPHSVESEQGVLGCILLSPSDTLTRCLAVLEGPQAFYELRHQNIYEHLVDMHKNKVAIDIITLQQRLKDNNILEQVGGLQYLASLPDCVPSASNLEYYLPIVKEKHFLRKLIKFCLEVADLAKSGTAAAADLQHTVLRDVKQICGCNSDDAEVSSSQCASRFTDDLQARYDRQGAPSGIYTGLHDYDRITDGLQFGEQVVIGARPSQGKTAFGLTIINHACIINRIPSLFISFEMSVEALMRRLAAIHMRIGMKALRTGQLNQEDVLKMPRFVSIFRNSPLKVLDFSRGAGVAKVVAAIAKAAQEGVKLVVIDYLQKIKASIRNEKRTYEVADVSCQLRAAAVDNNIAMVTLAQLNREPDKGGKNGRSRFPKMSDLADSAQIERDADVIALLHRERDENSCAMLIAKNRDGECGLVNLHFNGVFCQFTNGVNQATQYAN